MEAHIWASRDRDRHVGKCEICEEREISFCFGVSIAVHLVIAPQSRNGKWNSLWRKFALARTKPVGDYLDACARRVRFTAEVDLLLDEVDLLLTPALPVLHPPRDGPELNVAGKPLDYTMALVRQTCLFDHTGHPALGMPVSFASSDPGAAVPPSLQIVGRPGGECD
ncbi:amidase family protein [Rhizobium aethiopicum]|uniref:amidase family protein n=1 Tax=Rhizobium aethiopicum TaxID=1138170 RepID=UPI0032B1C866